jgi:hypothetical protein
MGKDKTLPQGIDSRNSWTENEEEQTSRPALFMNNNLIIAYDYQIVLKSIIYQ